MALTSGKAACEKGTIKDGGTILDTSAKIEPRDSTTDRNYEYRLDVFDEHHVKNLFANLPNALFVTDGEGNILVANSFAALTMGITVEHMVKSNVTDLLIERFCSKSYVFEAIRQKKVICGEVTTISGLKLDTVTRPIMDEDGQVFLVVVTGRPEDIDTHYNSKEKKDLKKTIRGQIKKLATMRVEHEYDKMVIESLVMRQIFWKCHDIAKTDSAVLLYGESGTGKEVMSRFIHLNIHNKRSSGPFISVNCAAIPETLFESELFGYEKGAFTGASETGKVGILEMAHGGTLFLDEISEMPLSLQPKLLRVLDSGEVRRIGGTQIHKVDLRLICATNRDLSEMVGKGAFRKDLYYRINVIPITIPPLRERPEDILGFANKFLAEFNKRYQKNCKLSSTEILYLLNHNWPGNVRELRNYIERFVVTSRMNPDDQMEIDLASRSGATDGSGGADTGRPTLKEFVRKTEETFIRQTLAECNGKLGVTAKKLGICRTVLYKKLKSFETTENNTQ